MVTFSLRWMLWETEIVSHLNATTLLKQEESDYQEWSLKFSHHYLNIFQMTEETEDSTGKYSPARGRAAFGAHSAQRPHRGPKTLQEAGARPCLVALWSGTWWSLANWHLQDANSAKRCFHLFTLALHSCLCFSSVALNCPICIASFVLF